MFRPMPAKLAPTERKAPLFHDPESVRWVRERSGLSQTQTAKRVGISTSLLCDIEKGRRSARPDVLATLADVLNCPVVMLERKSWTSASYAAEMTRQRDDARRRLASATFPKVEG